MSVKLLTSGGGGVVLTPSSSIASDQTMYLPVSGVSGGTVVCSDSSGTTTLNSSAGYSPLVAKVNGTEYMRLDSSGNLLVGTTSTSVANGGVVLYKNNGADGNSLVSVGHKNGTSSGEYYSIFYYNSGGIGSITQNGTTAVAYNTTSDHRLKTNVRDADAKSFGNVKFRDFEWVDGRHDCGVIAHELQEVYPDLVLGEKDAVDEGGNPVYQQVNYTGLICRMGTVIQQLTERIAVLEGA